MKRKAKAPLTSLQKANNERVSKMYAIIQSYITDDGLLTELSALETSFSTTIDSHIKEHDTLLLGFKDASERADDAESELDDYKYGSKSGSIRIEPENLRQQMEIEDYLITQQFPRSNQQHALNFIP